MTSLRTHVALLIGAVGLLASCSGGADGSMVRFDMELAPFQPWTATGELVNAGEMCPEGTRTNIGYAHPDGSPITPEELGEQALELSGAGTTDRELFEQIELVAWEQYLCDDGSGTFTLRGDFDPGERQEVVEGSGAYLGMTGDCTLVVEFDDTDEMVAMWHNCAFEMGP